MKRKKADLMVYHIGHLFHIVDLDGQHGMWTLNNVIFKVKVKDGAWESNLQWATVWQLVFQVHSQPNILGFTVLLSFILGYWLLFFEFLLIFFFFYKKPALATHTHHKSHLKIVAQTLRRKREEKFESKEKKIKSNLWKGSG